MSKDNTCPNDCDDGWIYDPEWREHRQCSHSFHGSGQQEDTLTSQPPSSQSSPLENVSESSRTPVVSANEVLGLPRDKMRKVLIAFDVDGTLISNEDDSQNLRIVQLLQTLASFKNTKIMVWSGGGKDYADMWVRRLGLAKYVDKTCCKCPDVSPDIAIDDIQDTAIGTINLIVREK